MYVSSFVNESLWLRLSGSGILGDNFFNSVYEVFLLETYVRAVLLEEIFYFLEFFVFEWEILFVFFLGLSQWISLYLWLFSMSF